MGGFLSNLLDTNVDYDPEGKGGGVQAGNPYNKDMFMQSMNNQQQIYGQQQALAQQLQNQAAGIGPNPAQTQYKQNVGQNIANAQGLISSQRGLNPALATRMGANAASQANQQAAAQSSILQQQQQLGATQNLGNLYGQMQQGNLGQQGAFTQANLGAMRGNLSAQLANQQSKQALAGGLMSSIGSAMQGPISGGGGAHGGMVSRYAEGGAVSSGETHDYTKMTDPKIGKPQSAVGKALAASTPVSSGPGALYAGMADIGKGAASMARSAPPEVMSVEGPVTQMPAQGANAEQYDTRRMVAAKGGLVPAMLSPGEVYLSPSKVSAVSKQDKNPIADGKRIPGSASVSGDSYQNDTVPAKLEEGGIVIPRSVTQRKDAPEAAAKFVAAILARKKHGK